MSTRVCDRFGEPLRQCERRVHLHAGASRVITAIRIGAPTSRAKAYCHPRKMNANAATSTARLVEANMNASAEVRAAPFVQRLRVAKSAAKEHDDQMNPTRAARMSWLGVPLPSLSAAARRDTNTWIAALIAHPGPAHTPHARTKPAAV